MPQKAVMLHDTWCATIKIISCQGGCGSTSDSQGQDLSETTLVPAWVSSRPGGRFNIKTPSCQYRNYHNKDKDCLMTVLSLWRETLSLKKLSLYWNRAQNHRNHGWGAPARPGPSPISALARCYPIREDVVMPHYVPALIGSVRPCKDTHRKWDLTKWRTTAACRPHPHISAYKMEHLVFFFFFTWRAALVAVSKTSRTPSFVLAEHSR